MNILGFFKRRWRLLLAALAVYLVFLIVKIPASLAVQFIEADDNLAAMLQLQGVDGTIWNGHADTARVNKLTLNNLTWDLNVLPMLLGQLDVDVRFGIDKGHGRANVALGFGGDVELSDVQARVPAQALMPLLYGFPVALVGEFSANLNNVEIQQGQRFAADGRLVWHGAGVSAPQALGFGDLALKLEPDGEGSKGVVSDGGGPLSVEGTFTVQPNGQYQMNLRLASRETGNTPLKAALGFLGRPDSQGKVTFRKGGRLAL